MVVLLEGAPGTGKTLTVESGMLGTSRNAGMTSANLVSQWRKR
jgi:ATP-dependent 26S proteasome regulatory subunit